LVYFRLRARASKVNVQRRLALSRAIKRKIFFNAVSRFLFVEESSSVYCQLFVSTGSF